MKINLVFDADDSVIKKILLLVMDEISESVCERVIKTKEYSMDVEELGDNSEVKEFSQMFTLAVIGKMIKEYQKDEKKQNV